MFDEFESRNTKVIAIAQEDTDLASHAKFLKHFTPGPRFTILADLNREKTKAFDHTTIYIINKDGAVGQILPNMVHYRASWDTVLHEIDRLNK